MNIGSSNKIDVRIKLFVDDVWLGRCVVSELLRYVLHEKLRICVTVFCWCWPRVWDFSREFCGLL